MTDALLALTLARRELRGGLRGLGVFLACLALGVAAIAAVGSSASAIRAGLASDANTILGGDIDLRLANRTASHDERAYLERAAAVSEVVELRAMARERDARALVELKAVDGAYPLIGALQLFPDIPIADALAEHNGLWGAVAEQGTLDRLSALQTDDQSPAVTTAQGVVAQAQAAYAQSQKGVAQAQANLDLLDAQLAKLTVYAPMDGVILTRSVEPGEFVQPGAAALTMGNIRQLTITVYVPEDRYGQISLGQKANVRVDTFPELTFTAAVTHIADQAEFTPRNVQTAEGRSSTVYAIKLTVTDPGGKLKPGMPADVTFEK